MIMIQNEIEPHEETAQRGRTNIRRRDYLPFGRPNFSKAEIAAVTRALESGWIGMGAETLMFERELGVFVGSPRVIAVNSCTSALFLSLLTHGIGPGDEVICPSLTWCSSANAALYLGAKVVFCDVDEDTLCMTPETAAACLSRRTRAVIAVHFGGRAVDVRALREVLPSNVRIIEDAAHALGAYDCEGRPVGSSGNLTCFSFYANKNLSTGEGGAIAVADDGLAERLASLRQHGLPVDAWKRFSEPHSMIMSPPLTDLGYKMNYTDLQACIGRVQLRRQEEFRRRRFAISQYYQREISERHPTIEFQKGALSERHARHLFLLKGPWDWGAARRDALVRSMRHRNIGATVHYAPLHRMPLYGYHAPLPVTESVWERLITLPISASMSLGDAEDVLKALDDALEEG